MPNTFSLTWQAVIQPIAQHLQACDADPTHTVVLLPFAQLLPIARKQWAQAHPNSFAPRFETTSSWAQRLQAFVPTNTDIAFDAAVDLLTAQRLLYDAGYAQDADWLASRVYESAIQLAPIAAAKIPNVRVNWATDMQKNLLLQSANTPPYEQRITAIALLWAGHSSYASDILFDAIEKTQALIVFSGLQPDALTDTLVRHMQQHQPQALAVYTDWHTHDADPHATAVCVHHTPDLEEQAQCAAAAVQDAVMRHTDNAHVVALIDNDRALSRRIRAILAAQGLAIRDETGWRLSTTVAAGHIMGTLNACLPDASSDQVISWAKSLPHAACPTPHVDAIEVYLRKQQLAQWQPTGFWDSWQHAAHSTAQKIQRWRKQLQKNRPLEQWLVDLRQLLQDTQQWNWFTQDHAGLTVLQALHWQEGSSYLHCANKWRLSEFIQWMRQTLERTQFKPEYPLQEQVALVPLSQTLARPFAAIIMPGCDENRLPTAPEPAGMWSAKQRAILGLDSHEQRARSQRLAWRHLLSFEHVVLLTSHSEAGSELLDSPLLLEWQLAPVDIDITYRAFETAPDLRKLHTITSKKLPYVATLGSKILPQTMSASSYSLFSACPYCFFVFKLLKLQDITELQDGIDKRDFGAWVHETLQLFHEALQKKQHKKLPDMTTLYSLLDQAAETASTRLCLDAAAFLPYQSTWQKVAVGYLHWLQADYAETQAQFTQGESSHQRLLGDFINNAQKNLAHIELVGRIDRIDALPKTTQDSPTMRLMDYKTEALNTTKRRIVDTQENIQLALYAALLSPQAVSTGYLNISTKGEVRLLVPPDIQQQGSEIVEEIHQYLKAIAAGKPLMSLGQEPYCKCKQHGINRSDIMQDPS